MAVKDNKFDPMNMSVLTQDAFRTLRMNVLFSGGEKDIQTLVVTSSVPNEGKTYVSIGLGIAMAEAGRRTLIIDCDCRKPSVGNRLQLRPEKTWLDVLYNGVPVEQAIAETNCQGLFFLDVEPGIARSIEQLSGYRFHKMVEGLRNQFGFIIFDTPPVGAFIDAAALAEHADGAVMVISSGNQEVRLLKASLEQLKKAGANFIGIVLNKVKVSRTSSYYRYGDYYYHGRESSSSKKLRTKKQPTEDDDDDDWDE